MINHKTLNTIFNVWDPLDVMYHAPMNEYRQLTDEVLERMHPSMTEEKIFNVVYEIGNVHFGDFTRMNEKSCRFISELIYQISNSE
jgi:hypothetical protein